MEARVGRAALTAAIIAFSLAASPAQALSFEDIAGKWCTEVGSSQFTPEAIIIRKPDGARFDLKIDHYAYTDTVITVFWVRRADATVTSTDYGELSADRRTMAQLASSDGPRRAHHRC